MYWKNKVMKLIDYQKLLMENLFKKLRSILKMQKTNYFLQNTIEHLNLLTAVWLVKKMNNQLQLQKILHILKKNKNPNKFTNSILIKLIKLRTCLKKDK